MFFLCPRNNVEKFVVSSNSARHHSRNFNDHIQYFCSLYLIEWWGLRTEGGDAKTTSRPFDIFRKLIQLLYLGLAQSSKYIVEPIV